jgi:hypothetical protein
VTVRRCIPELLGQGKITDEQAGRMKDLFEGFEGIYGDEASASRATADAFEHEAMLKRRQNVLQLRAQQKIAADVRRFRIDRPGLAAEALLAADDRAPYRNVEFMEKAIANEHFAMMNELIDRFSRDFAGRVRDVATLHDVLREAFGEETGNATAKVLSKAWLETAESLRLRFNERGGAIGKIDKWGMPQVHSMMAVRAVSFDEWRDFLMGTDEAEGLLDRGNMVDQETGLPMTPQRLELALRSVYDTIISDGWNERNPGAFTGNGKIANRHADARFLKFKDANSWLAYSQRFGRPLSSLSAKFDPGSAIYDAMISHIHGMSRDIALMERLGPNPSATIRWLTDSLQKEARLPKYPGDKRIKQAEASAIRIDNMFKELTGGFAIEHPAFAKAMSSARAWESAAKLGSAFLSSQGDIATSYVTRRFNGLPAMRAAENYVATLKPTSAADRAHAARQRYIAESAVRTMGAYNRWTGETMTGEIPARLSNAVMHLSLLDKWTDEGRRLFNKQVWAAITDNANKSWDTLGKSGMDRRFRRMLTRYGLGEGEWNAIRATPLQEDGGAHWILPDNIADPDLARRISEMALQETEMAIPSSSLRIRAKVDASLRKGSIPGEIARSFLQFRGYPLQLFWSHGRRALEEGGWGAFKYAATLFVTSTVMGALAYQLGRIATGQDIANMDVTKNPDFITQAIFKGGGLGIFGDLVQHINAKDWRDFLTQNAGPLYSGIQDVGAVAFSKNHGKALARAIKNNTPGSTLWYAKLAFQREVIDQMQAQIDPNYRQSGAKMEQYARQHGTRYWWRPFHGAPDRAPQMSQQVPPQPGG